MTLDQIQLVRATFAKVLAIKAQAAAIFYDRLFQVAPQIRSLFPEDLAAQGDKLMSAIGFVVVGLDRLEAIIPQVHELGRRHAGYGVQDEHYAIVGECLIWTLDIGLGPAFTPEVREAWIEAYGLLAEAMIAAARLRAA